MYFDLPSTICDEFMFFSAVTEYANSILKQPTFGANNSSKR